MGEAKRDTALVTGATGALGGAFCERLVACGLTVVATGRNEAALACLALRLPGISTITCDLAAPDAVEQLLIQLPHVDFLVAVAGATEDAAFEQRRWCDVQEEILLNAVNVARLVHAYGSGMLKAGGGRIITVASTAAGRPAPRLAAYAASKSFVLVLSRALAAEWRDKGVSVCCCVPGPIKSEFAKRARLGDRAGGLNPSAVAEAALKAIASGHTMIFPDFGSWLRWKAYTLIPDNILSQLISASRRSSPMMYTESFLGINFEVGTIEAALDKIEGLICHSRSISTVVMHANLNTLFTCAKNQRLKMALAHPNSVILFEGIALKLARFMTTLAWWPDVNGTDLVPLFLGMRRERNLRLALVGGRQGIAEAAGQMIAERFPKILIVETLNGFADLSDKQAALVRIRAAKPDVLLLGLGTPFQEIMAADWARSATIPLIWTVGGLFDLWAGDRKRPPSWIIACRLEWLWRLALQPSLYWQRTFIQGPWLLRQIVAIWRGPK